MTSEPTQQASLFRHRVMASTPIDKAWQKRYFCLLPIPSQHSHTQQWVYSIKPQRSRSRSTSTRVSLEIGHSDVQRRRPKPRQSSRR